MSNIKIEQLVKLVIDGANNTRTSENNGFTTTQMHQLLSNPNPRVGRNAPCPCGSGRKYKHCCGK